MRVFVAAVALASVVAAGYGVTSIGHGARSHGIFEDHGTLTVQAWSFDNKNHKNKNKPTVHHGLW